MFINVTFAEKPFFVLAGLDNILEESVYFQTLENINSETVLKRCRRLVSNDVVNSVVVLFEIEHSFLYLFMGRLFTFPPVLITAEINILTVSAAESKYLLIFDSVYLSYHEVDYIRSDNSCHSAVPCGLGEFFKNIKVFVASVNESYGKILAAQFL